MGDARRAAAEARAGRFKASIDPEAPGGAYLLGLRSLGVVPHGRFTRAGFAQAIIRAAQGSERQLTDLLHQDLEAAGALRRPPASAGASTGADTSVGRSTS